MYTKSLEAHPADGKHSVMVTVILVTHSSKSLPSRPMISRYLQSGTKPWTLFATPLHCALSSAKTVIGSQQRRAQWHSLWSRLCGELREIQKQYL